MKDELKRLIEKYEEAIRKLKDNDPYCELWASKAGIAAFETVIADLEKLI